MFLNTSLMYDVSLMKKKLRFPRYLSICPPATYVRGVMSTPYLSLGGSYRTKYFYGWRLQEKLKAFKKILNHNSTELGQWGSTKASQDQWAKTFTSTYYLKSNFTQCVFAESKMLLNSQKILLLLLLPWE
jgi:hypothetical protein